MAEKDVKKAKVTKKVVEEEFEEVEENGSALVWLKENILAVIFGIVGILIGVVIMTFLWPERIAELSDGGQVALSYNGKQMTADDVYNLVKKKNTLTTLLEEIDTEYLTEYYKATLQDIYDLAKEEADQYIAYYIEMAGYSEEEFYQNMGFKDYDDMLFYLKRNALREQYVDDALKAEITDADLQQFYKLYAFGDKTKVYIFLGENKDDLESVRKLLGKGKEFSEIDGKYSSVTGINLEDTNFLTLYEDYGAEITEMVKKLDNKSYSKVTKNTYYKYVVVYAEGTAETADYSIALADDIRTTLVSQKKNADTATVPKKLIEMREKIGLVFKDTELAKAYEEYKKQYE